MLNYVKNSWEFQPTILKLLCLNTVIILLTGLGCEDETAETSLPENPATSPRFKAPEIAVPDTLPMLGPEGQDEHGYPLKTADAVGFMTLLRGKRFDELTRYIEKLQSDFEDDFRKERWPSDALRAFNNPDPSMEPLLDQWAKEHSDSFAPYAARGTYLTSVGYFHRGTKYSGETSSKRFDVMNRFHIRALQDLQQALVKNPKAIFVHERFIEIYRANGDASSVEEHYREAFEVCEPCFEIREAYLFALRPRWIGSMEAMAKAATEAQSYAEENPKLVVLKGYPDWERCTALLSSKLMSEALAACNKALQYGDHWQFLATRGEVYAKLNDYEKSFRDLDRATTLYPASARRYQKRAAAHYRMKRYEQAGDDILTSMRLNPMEQYAQKLAGSIVKGVLYAGRQHMFDGDTEKARSAFELAITLAPKNADVRRHLKNLNAAPTDEELEAAQKHLQEHAEDFDAYVKLDRILTKRGALRPVTKLWDGFLEKRPDEPRAFMERGGAYYNLGELEPAERDMQKACSFGLKAACSHVSRIRSQRSRSGGP